MKAGVVCSVAVWFLGVTSLCSVLLAGCSRHPTAAETAVAELNAYKGKPLGKMLDGVLHLGLVGDAPFRVALGVYTIVSPSFYKCLTNVLEGRRE